MVKLCDSYFSHYQHILHSINLRIDDMIVNKLNKGVNLHTYIYAAQLRVVQVTGNICGHI